jgi:hypothetical protein
MALLEIFKFLSCHLQPEFAVIGSEVWFARVFLIPSGLKDIPGTLNHVHFDSSPEFHKILSHHRANCPRAVCVMVMSSPHPADVCFENAEERPIERLKAVRAAFAVSI